MSRTSHAHRHQLASVAIAALCLTSIFVASSAVEARGVRHVPRHHKTIQSAIQTAKPGDTVLVEEGVYYENLVIRKNIVLGSLFLRDGDSSHISRTIIDGSKAHNKERASTIHVVGETDTTCAIVGLTIRGGTGSLALFPGDRYGNEWMVGGGIYVQRAGIRIAHNYVTGNLLRKTGTVENMAGAGIGCFEVPPSPGIPPYVIIEHNVVTLNTAAGKWAEVAGIAVQGPGRIRYNRVIQNRLLFRNRSAGGGIGLILGKRYDIIADNEAFEVGGGIETTENSNAVIINNTIVGNRAGSLGDGIMVTTGGTVTLINNILWRNGRYQLSAWTNVRLVNNLVEGGARGVNTVDADPLFIPGDTLFRLSPESPAIGTGSGRVYLGSSHFPLPTKDYFGSTRTYDASAGMSMGALEPMTGENAQAKILKRRQQDEAQTRLRLAITVRQVAPPILSADSLQKLKAGRMAFQIIKDDTVKQRLEQNEEDRTFTLPPESNLLECEFIAHDANVPRGISRMIQLEGHDQYSTITRNRPYSYRQYANLLPGTYHLLTAAGDETGFIAESNKRRVTIIVLPYWYQRWWAYGLMSVLIVMVVVLVYRREVNRLQKERQLQQEFTKKAMESQEAERKRLASELHDSLGQDLLIVNNELQQLQKNGTAPSSSLDRITGLIQESIEEVREISSNLHPHQIERLGFCAAIKAMADKVSHASGTPVRWSCDQQTIRLPRNAEIHAYRIIQESLSNAVRYASASEIDVEVRRTNGRIEMTVRDNGIGFDPARPIALTGDGNPFGHRGFGIPSMTERARIVGGTVVLDSVPGRGTTVHLTLPAEEGTP